MKRSPADAGPSERQSYRSREVAALGGVTVKALLHYHRVELLMPARTPAGHRVYSLRDLERLRRILALRRVGIPLGRMRPLLDADPAALITRLGANRETLTQERERLRRADRAIAVVEECFRHTPDDSGGLSRLVDVLDMPREAVRMRRYFHDEVWEQAKRFYEEWPDERWTALYRDIAKAIPEGPGGDTAADLLRRWNTLAQSLWRDLTSDPAVAERLHEGFARAWRDRENWPDTLKRRFADYRMDEVAAFLGRVPVRNPSGAPFTARHT